MDGVTATENCLDNTASNFSFWIEQQPTCAARNQTRIGACDLYHAPDNQMNDSGTNLQSYHTSVTAIVEKLDALLLREDLRTEFLDDLQDAHQQVVFEMERGGGTRGVSVRTLTAAWALVDDENIDAATLPEPHQTDDVSELQFSFEDLTVANPNTGSKEHQNDRTDMSCGKRQMKPQMFPFMDNGMENREYFENNRRTFKRRGHYADMSAKQGPTQPMDIPVYVGPSNKTDYYLG